MEDVSGDVIERGISVVYRELGIDDAVRFLRAISGGKGNFTLEHKKMPEFSDENVKSIFLKLTKGRSDQKKQQG